MTPDIRTVGFPSITKKLCTFNVLIEVDEYFCNVCKMEGIIACPPSASSSTPDPESVFNITQDPTLTGVRHGAVPTVTVLCGTFPFCDESANHLCYGTPVHSCELCSLANGAVLVSFFVLLALAIIIGNFMIIGVGWIRYQKKTMNKVDIVKTSLAIADTLIGVLLLIFIPYNFHWTFQLPFRDIVKSVLSTDSSSKALANFVAIAYMFGFTSSLYHLNYMGLQRLYAVWKPFEYRSLSKRTVQISLCVVWILSIISASSTVWFPNFLTSDFMASLLFFVPSLRSSEDLTGLVWVSVWFYLVPFLFMTVVTVGVGILSVAKMRLTKKYLNNKLAPNNDNKKDRKIERQVFITVAIMQIGFTIAMAPMIIISGLFYVGTLNCRNFTIPHVIAFYFSLANSLVNVIVYNIREKKFRISLRRLVSKAFQKKVSSTTANTTATALGHSKDVESK